MLPALWVWSVKILGITVCNGRTATAEAQQFALAALLKLLMLTILFHHVSMENVIQFFVNCTYIAVKPPASHQTPFSRNSEMAVATVASIVDGIVVKTFGNLKQSLLVKEECPEMILQVERGFRVLILLILRPAPFEKVTILERLDVPIFHVRLVF